MYSTLFISLFEFTYYVSSVNNEIMAGSDVSIILKGEIKYRNYMFRRTAFSRWYDRICS